MVESLMWQKEYRFTAKIEKSSGGKYHWSVKASGDTIEELETNIKLIRTKMKNLIDDIKTEENIANAKGLISEEEFRRIAEEGERLK